MKQAKITTDDRKVTVAAKNRAVELESRLQQLN